MKDSMERKDVSVTANNTPNDENMIKKEVAAEEKQEAAPQKKKMSAVFRPQNSAQGGRPGAQRRPAGGTGANGQRRPAGTAGSAGATRRPASEAGTGARRPSGTGAAAPVRKPAAKPEEAVKVSPVPETKSEVKSVPAPEVKAEVKVAPAPEAKLEGKAAPAPETKSEAKATLAPKTKSEGKAAPALETKSEVKVTPASEAKSEAKQVVLEKKSEGKASQVAENRSEDRRVNNASRPQNQNRDGQSRDGQRSGGRDGQRSFNRDGQSRDGQRSFNRDGQPRDGQRPYNRDGQSRDGQRPFNRDGQPRDGQRPFNRDGQSRDGQRSFNRDGQNRDGQRPFNRDGQNRDGQRPFNRDGQNRDGQRSFDRDGQNRNYGQNRGGRSEGGMSIPAPQLDVMQKPSSKQKANKVANNKQNNRYDKKNSDDDFGKKPGGKNVKLKTPLKPVTPKPEPVKEEIKSIVIPETLTIKELAEHMKKQPSEIVKKLFMQGKIVTINQEIDFATAEEIAMEFEILCEQEVKVDVIEELLRDTEDAEETMVSRPPVVCVMGHVDHGKTSLLDAIRTTSVTAREAGGITQHIGAYTVEINDRKITFLDTPGHEAFTAMRMRGAQSTDIAVLVVAADDGVKPQTVEAINHAKAAGVEIVVAINKIDKPAANVEKVKQELTEYGLIPEDWGGSNVFVPVSAKSKEGIEDLLEMILLTADVMELKSNPNRLARGLVIEAQLDKGKGSVATVLVQKGTLHVGDFIAAGSAYGKVKAMTDDKGRRVKEAGPSIPVEIMGLNNVPNAGEVCVSTATEKDARHFAETFIKEGREKMLADTKAKMSLDDLFSQIQAGNLKELNLIVKADVQGSVEAVKQSLLKLSNEEVVVKIIHSGVGAINESDVTLASTSSAIIIGFNVRPDATAKSIADAEKVDVRLYRVIYQAIEDIEAAMKGMLDPIYEEKIIGHAMVRAIFKASGVGNIAGSYVTDGKFVRNCKIRITRAGEQIYEGALASLKRMKDDVKEVAKGFECGMVFDGFGDLQEDDLIEGYIMEEVPR